MFIFLFLFIGFYPFFLYFLISKKSILNIIKNIEF